MPLSLFKLYPDLIVIGKLFYCIKCKDSHGYIKGWTFIPRFARQKFYRKNFYVVLILLYIFKNFGYLNLSSKLKQIHDRDVRYYYN